jgi:hypothetical protein
VAETRHGLTAPGPTAGAVAGSDRQHTADGREWRHGSAAALTPAPWRPVVSGRRQVWDRLLACDPRDRMPVFVAAALLHRQAPPAVISLAVPDPPPPRFRSGSLPPSPGQSRARAAPEPGLGAVRAHSRVRAGGPRQLAAAVPRAEAGGLPAPAAASMRPCAPAACAAAAAPTPRPAPVSPDAEPPPGAQTCAGSARRPLLDISTHLTVSIGSARRPASAMRPRLPLPTPYAPSPSAPLPPTRQRQHLIPGPPDRALARLTHTAAAAALATPADVVDCLEVPPP